MAGKKNGASDPHFMPNLEAAIREEARRVKSAAARPALPPPASPATAPPASKGVSKAKGQGAAATRRAAPETKADRASILKELRSLLPKLDAEGLAFLLEQAKTHLYNMEVERLNSSRSGLKGASSQDANGSVASRTGLRLDRSDSGSSYYVWANGDSIMFTMEEMLALVRIAQGHEDEAEASRAIRAWLERERRDAIEGLRLPGSSRPALLEFARLLRKSSRKPGKG